MAHDNASQLLFQQSKKPPSTCRQSSNTSDLAIVVLIDTAADTGAEGFPRENPTT